MPEVSVVSLDKATADRFVREKHYSRRPAIFWAGFALVVDGLVDGVVVYGQPSPPISRHAFRDRDFRLYELSRLVIQTELKNAASILVGRSLQLLGKPCAVVSYADSEWGHAGIVYQATNWLYTGATKSHDHSYLVDGVRTHPMTLRGQGITDPKRWAKEHGVQTLPPAEKHRYFYLNGSPRDKRTMRAKLAYPVIAAYPKTEKRMYDDGPLIDVHYGSAA